MTRMHHIQIKILQTLLRVETGTYAAMRPGGVESNHYAYHLEQLMRDDLVSKEGKNYALSPLGLELVDRMTQESMLWRMQPNIVTAIDLTTPDGKSLLFKRNFHPYFHLIGFPMGRLHLGEDVHTAATRELEEKTGLTDIPLTHRGMIYVDAKQNGETISKMLYHVFDGSGKDLPPVALSPERGVCFWADHHDIPADQLMPGYIAIKTLLATEKQLFFNETTESAT